MGDVLGTIGDALGNGFQMAWEVWWALVLGFLLSGIVQAWVTRGQMERALGGRGLAATLKGTGLGAASSSCSYCSGPPRYSFGPPTLAPRRRPAVGCVHGRTARTVVPCPGLESTSSRPSIAARRYLSPRRPVPPAKSAPPTPSSPTSTASGPLRSVTATEATEACVAEAYLATLSEPRIRQSRRPARPARGAFGRQLGGDVDGQWGPLGERLGGGIETAIG